MIYLQGSTRRVQTKKYKKYLIGDRICFAVYEISSLIFSVLAFFH